MGWHAPAGRRTRQRGPLRQAPSRSFRTMVGAGWEPRARPTDHLKDNPEKASAGTVSQTGLEESTRSVTATRHQDGDGTGSLTTFIIAAGSGRAAHATYRSDSSPGRLSLIAGSEARSRLRASMCFLQRARRIDHLWAQQLEQNGAPNIGGIAAVVAATPQAENGVRFPSPALECGTSSLWGGHEPLVRQCGILQARRSRVRTARRGTCRSSRRATGRPPGTTNAASPRSMKPYKPFRSTA